MIIVYSLGGSILAGQDAAGLQSYADELKDIAREHQVYVVVGGGRIARDYIGRARALGSDESFCDLLGIAATRLNAMLLMAALGGRQPEVPDSYAMAMEHASLVDVVVMGGLYPGQTTDAVAALLAERVHADRMVIATSVDGVYTADPETDSSARKIESMSPAELVRMAMDTELKAGSRSPVDPIAAKIIERSGITTTVVHGQDISNLRKGFEGTHTGTKIVR
ncbi:MAG: UMP kinase [Methanosarcinales archaeon]|nr:UMP kinase [Methanosarcinales archaeon]